MIQRGGFEAGGAEKTTSGFRSGFVAIVGRPNVGKSTLVNRMVGGKIAITSSRPQTTRGSIRGILDVPDAQVVFIDTPGYHKPRTLLGERLNEIVRAAWSDVDLVLLLVDGKGGIGAGDEKIASAISDIGPDVFLVVNKIDRLRPEEIAVSLTKATALRDFEEYVPVSAATGENVDHLTGIVVDRMREGPMYYPPGTRSDQPPPAFVAELVREKLLARTREELPHSIAVVTEDYEERDDGVLMIQAIVYVERESQKGMVIGKGGDVIKAAGTEARLEIEALFGRKVFIDLRVKVEKDWQQRAYALERLGFNI